jgi:hypothetical protein
LKSEKLVSGKDEVGGSVDRGEDFCRASYEAKAVGVQGNRGEDKFMSLAYAVVARRVCFVFRRESACGPNGVGVLFGGEIWTVDSCICMQDGIGWYTVPYSSTGYGTR